MDVKEYMKMEIEGLDRQFSRVLDGLTQKEIEWRPASGCNSIGLILFHIYRAEDSFMHMDKTPTLWETGKWYEKLGLDKEEGGAHYTVEQVNAFPVPKLSKIQTYGAAVRRQTLAAVKKIKAAELDKMIKMPWAEMPAAAIWSMITGHATQHLGEMSYIRGIQRGMDK